MNRKFFTEYIGCTVVQLFSLLRFNQSRVKESIVFSATVQFQVGVVFSRTLIFFGLQDLLKDGFHNGHHHRHSRGVLDPHGEQGTARHEPQHQPKRVQEEPDVKKSKVWIQASFIFIYFQSSLNINTCPASVLCFQCYVKGVICPTWTLSILLHLNLPDYCLFLSIWFQNGGACDFTGYCYLGLQSHVACYPCYLYWNNQ